MLLMVIDLYSQVACAGAVKDVVPGCCETDKEHSVINNAQAAMQTIAFCIYVSLSIQNAINYRSSCYGKWSLSRSNGGIHHARATDQPSSKAPSRAGVQFFVPDVFGTRQLRLEYSRFVLEPAIKFCRSLVSSVEISKPRLENSRGPQSLMRPVFESY